jgi:hypothetical protein
MAFRQLDASGRSAGDWEGERAEVRKGAGGCVSGHASLMGGARAGRRGMARARAGGWLSVCLGASSRAAGCAACLRERASLNCEGRRAAGGRAGGAVPRRSPARARAQPARLGQEGQQEPGVGRGGEGVPREGAR